MTTTAQRALRLPASAIDSFHSMLMDDDQFNEAMMRVALQVAEDMCKNAPCETDEEDVYDLAMELCIRVSVA